MWASADGRGNVDLWNLSVNTEQPVLRQTVCSRAVNRLCWTVDGRRLLVGDATGAVTMWDVHGLSAARPTDVAAFEDRLREFSTTASSAAATAAAPESGVPVGVTAGDK